MSVMWNWRARLYDFREASALRRGPAKTELFANMRGRVVFVAAGTGTDFVSFPPGRDVTAIDINDEMLRRAEARRSRYNGDLRLLKADALALPFDDASFDTAVTSCTMCSVPDPVRALRELHRVLRPDGLLLMFEHVRSRNPVLGWTLDLMTLWSRRTGTEMNRDTLANAAAAGFRITSVESVYLDIILAVRAVKAPTGPPGSRCPPAGHATTAPPGPAQPLHDALQHGLDESGGHRARGRDAVLPLPPDRRVERHQGRGVVQAPLTTSHPATTSMERRQPGQRTEPRQPGDAERREPRKLPCREGTRPTPLSGCSPGGMMTAPPCPRPSPPK